MFQESVPFRNNSRKERQQMWGVGSAAACRHRDKMTKYFQVFDIEGIQFFPLALEPLGGWQEDEEIVSKVARQLATRTLKKFIQLAFQ